MDLPAKSKIKIKIPKEYDKNSLRGFLLWMNMAASANAFLDVNYYLSFRN